MISTFQQKHVLFRVPAHPTYLPCAFSPNIWSKKLIKVGSSCNINNDQQQWVTCPSMWCPSHLSLTKLQANKKPSRDSCSDRCICVSHICSRCALACAPCHLSHWASFFLNVPDAKSSLPNVPASTRWCKKFHNHRLCSKLQNLSIVSRCF